MQAGDPDEAEAVVRSQMLLVGFFVLDRPLPKMLHAYATRRVGEDGTVIPLDLGQPGVNGRAHKNKQEETRHHSGVSAEPGPTKRAAGGAPDRTDAAQGKSVTRR